MYNLNDLIENHYDTIIGCMNRICVSDDIKELEQMQNSAIYHLNILYKLNITRILDKKMKMICIKEKTKEKYYAKRYSKSKMANNNK